jgi:hypothetical protein
MADKFLKLPKSRDEREADIAKFLVISPFKSSFRYDYSTVADRYWQIEPILSGDLECSTCACQAELNLDPAANVYPVLFSACVLSMQFSSSAICSRKPFSRSAATMSLVSEAVCICARLCDLVSSF